MKKIIAFSIAVLINLGATASATAPLVAHKTHNKTAKVMPAGLAKWDTTKTDKMASWPDATDPTWKLPLEEQEVFACIRYHESRNHLQDGWGSQGWYQFTQFIWGYARTAIKGLPATPNQATGDQQSAVAVFYFKRNGNWAVQWAADSECW